MAHFTFKDLLLHNNPCFNCGIITQFSAYKIYITNNSESKLNTNLKDGILTINIKSKYYQPLNLIIDIENNNFKAPINQLKEYLNEFNLLFEKKCNICSSNSWTKSIKFNFDKGFVYPLELSYETYFFTDSENLYTINNNHTSKKSIIFVDKINGDHSIKSCWKRTIPILSFNTIKNKPHIIKKIKSYMLFS